MAAALDGEAAAGVTPDVVSVAVPVLSGASTIGVVRVSSPASAIDERARSRVRGLVVVAAISLVAAAAVALLIARSVTEPLRRLQVGTERVAAGHFGERVDEREGPAEVRRLAGSFNAMTERIATLVTRQRTFAGDASHQLRTPLTALRLQLERTAALLDDDAEGARRNLEAAEAETLRLQRLVDGLLVLARDYDSVVPRSSVDVAALVVERVEAWQPLAEEQGVSITSWCDEPGRATALVADGALEQVIDNYLDNAIAVAPSGSAIDVAVDTTRPHEVVVHVLDRGPGLTDPQLASAFDRFWRAPGADHEGTGLGLAIVAHLADQSGATVTLTHRPGGGLDAAIALRRRDGPD
ncbi:hypothetical protein BH24ACT5_BH24ACT5_08790 [soil metagenome]